MRGPGHGDQELHAALAQPAAEIVAVDDRQHDVEQRDLGGEAVTREQRSGRVVRDLGAMAEQLESLLKARRKITVVIHNEDTHGWSYNTPRRVMWVILPNYDSDVRVPSL